MRYTCPVRYIEENNLLRLLQRLFPTVEDFSLEVSKAGLIPKLGNHL